MQRHGELGAGRAWLSAVAIALLWPIAAVAQGFFPRGDVDCSATVGAADLVASVRALAGTSLCGNDDCNRDGVITSADVDCTAGCLFGQCEQIPGAPTVTSVIPDSASAIVPVSEIHVVGTNFGTSDRLKQVTIGGVSAEVVDFIAPDTLRVIVPIEVIPGPADVVVIDGDVAGPPFTISIAAPTPIGAPDTFLGTLDLLDLATAEFLALNLEADYGANAAVLRQGLEDFRDQLATQRAAIVADPSFTAAVQAQLDAAIDSSGVPDLLRQLITYLETAAAPGSATAAANTLVGIPFGQTAAVARGALAAAIRGAALTGAGLAAAAGVALLAGIAVGLVIALSTGSGGAAIPLILSMTFLNSAGNLATHPKIFGTVVVKAMNVSPATAALFFNTPQGDITVPLGSADNGALRFQVPANICGEVQLILFDTSTHVGSNPLSVSIQPELHSIEPTDAGIGSQLTLLASGALACVTQVRVIFEDHDSVRTITSPSGVVATIVPDVAAGPYMVTESVDGVQADEKYPLNIHALASVAISCSPTALFVQPQEPDAAECSFRGIPADVSLRDTTVHWNSSDVNVGLLNPATSAYLDTAFTPLRPGQTDVTASLECPSESHKCAGASLTSAAVTMTVTDQTPPDITLTSSPAPGMIRPGTTITVTAMAKDNVAPIGIDLIATGDPVVADDQQQGFTCSFADPMCETTFAVRIKSSGFTNGDVSIVAKTLDAAGNMNTSAPLSFTVHGNPDTTPPTVTILAPQDGGTVKAGDTVQISVRVTDNGPDDTGVKQVAVHADGPAVATGPSPEVVCLPMPLKQATRIVSFTVKSAADLANIADKQITVSAQAFDAAGSMCDDGNQSPLQTVTVTVGAPTITDISPNQVNAGQSITITGQGFGDNQADSTVLVGSGTAAVTSWSNTSIKATVPAAASGMLSVVVVVGGEPSNAVGITVLGTGDLQFTLEWQDTNDLDLHVIDPTGFEIYYAARSSPSGGTLDVDANAACINVTSKPKENIFWSSSAPTGQYTVTVVYYEGCTDPAAASSFSVGVRSAGQFSTLFSGSVGPGNTSASMTFTR
jgi:hypothetical protein